ncbi:hypothetical protein I2486_19200 [Cellulophaga sp. E16_2]|uniref:hypothetical protein n=1 Tax=Cellulophaga sp. E16_2 TaxID=2789297 RepID=UPI001A92B8E4|nr:hypothetical protein [Cellulophaga sp. E16_2]MBO0593531.1 hypothetical protein [Cellulophaga sp. E16_2]
MKGYKKPNSVVAWGFGLALLLALPVLVPVILSLFSNDSMFKKGVLVYILPGLIYFLYVLLVVRNYYSAQVAKKLKILEEYTLVIDEMVSETMKTSVFHSLFSPKSGLQEYYFIFYTKEYDKYIHVSSIAIVPNYAAVSLKSWEHLPIKIYIDPKELNDPKKGKSKKKIDKNTLRTFRFFKGSYNLEANYRYSLSEVIAKRKYFMSVLIVVPFFILCMYLFKVILALKI